MRGVLRCGRYQDTLAETTCDLLCVDAPYSSRTHSGHNGGAAKANRCTAEDEKRLRVDKRTGSVYAVGANRRQSIDYAAWSPGDVQEFVDFWHPKTRGWFVAMTDHVLAPVWAEALSRTGRYVFSPLAFIAPGSRVRMTGDGPAQWACWLVVARPRTPLFVRWGALPGGYTLPKGLGRAESKPCMPGGKPLWLLREVVKGYSRPGDTVCDPCAGMGTALLAASLEGRLAIGSEMSPATFALAQARITESSGVGLDTVSELTHDDLQDRQQHRASVGSSPHGQLPVGPAPRAGTQQRP